MIDVNNFHTNIIIVSFAIQTFERTVLLKKHIRRTVIPKITLNYQSAKISTNEYGLVHHRAAFVHAVEGFLFCGAAHGGTFLVAVLGIQKIVNYFVVSSVSYN